MGYHLPKNSIVLANVYEINRDSEIYPEPEVFRPERFLDGDDEEDDKGGTVEWEGEMKQRIHAFGYGRRYVLVNTFSNEDTLTDLTIEFAQGRI